ncbi:MAG TPA: hypothetical protein VHT53_05200 [Candidatus Elarobacter sp.]|nr:hypothetical protein [Candidatus Elarobacter sp.]
MMRLPAFSALLPSLALALALTPVTPARADDADVVVQAGHQGRPASCAPLHVKACNLGTGAQGERERDWTPLVADEAARVLREHGYAVIRRPADYDAHDTARAAVFLHFDGSVSPCGSGASVGFPNTTSRAFVDAWETPYRAWFPYRFVGENFTSNEHEYYGFRKVDAPQKLLIEFGEMTCPAQFAWMQPRLKQLGDRVAAFVMEQVPR